jgi:tight adherence protein B
VTELLVVSLAFVSVLALGIGPASLGHARAARRLAIARPGKRRRPVVRSSPRAWSWLASAFERADVELPVERAVRAWRVALLLAAALGLLFGGPPLAVLAGAATAFGPVLALRLARDRRARRLEGSLSAVLEAVAAELRGGRTLSQALVEVSQAADGSGEAISDLGAAVVSGVPVAQATDRWQRRAPGASGALVAAAIGLAAHAGGAAARAVDGVAATLRERRDVDAEANALAAQARLSAVVIAVAPLGFAAVAVAADPRATDFLLGSPIGWLCLAAGLGLDVASVLWMRRIVGSEPW